MKTNEIDLWRSKKTNDSVMNDEFKRNKKSIIKGFSSPLKFGTAGIRGIMGVGPGRMNVFTVARAAKAYAMFLESNNFFGCKREIVIGHDNRYNSKEFTLMVARVMNDNGIKAYIFPNNDLQPTPLVSFVTRKLGLAGAVMLTASHNPKEYNGFKVYSSKGSQLVEKETEEISKYMELLDPLNINEKEYEPFYVKHETIRQYETECLEIINNNGGIKNLDIAFSAQHGTSAKLLPSILREAGANVKVVEKQSLPLPGFNHTKSPNPEDSKSYKKVFHLAKKSNSDIILITDPDADRIGMGVKYKKRYKFLNGNESAAVYLNYFLENVFSGDTKNKYIVTTNVSGNLARKVAEKYGVKVIETNVGFKNIANVIEKEGDKDFLFAFEESYGCLINSKMSRDKDALQAAAAYAAMASFYKSKNSNIYSALLKMYDEFGLHRTSQFSKKVDNSITKNLFREMKKNKGFKIQGNKISEIIDYRSIGSNLVKCIFENGSWFAVRPSGTEPKLKIYVETVGGSETKPIDIVYFEKAVESWINDNTEEFEEKHFSWKGFFKYLIFFILIVGTLVFVFQVIYSGAKDPTTNKQISTFTIAGNIMNKTNRWIWFSVWSWIIFMRVINAWKMKRMLKIQKQKVKLRHLFVASLMGMVISFITPFAIGGDAIGYWYLRRRGVKRGPLIATMMSDTMLFQIKFTLQTIILISIGLPIYEEIFRAGDIQAHAALIWFILGASWTVFATIMIFSLTLSKRFQEWIVITSVKLLEWTRFVMISDPNKIAATYQYEFLQLRKGMKDLWASWWVPIEMIFYSLIPLFVNPFTMIYLSSGTLNHTVAGVNGYMATIVIDDIVGTANSMSITPGGSGTGEWLSIVTRNLTINSPSEARAGIASGMDLLYKLLFGWPLLVISAISIPTVVYYENRRAKYEKLNKVNKLSKNIITNERTTSKKWISAGWIVLIAAFMIYFFLIW